jgi:Ketosteroid isomerase-related protein
VEGPSSIGSTASAPGVSPTALELLVAALRAVETKDLPTLLGLLDDKSVLIDPHYPVTRMAGRDAISDGLRWAFGAIVEFRFETIHAYVTGDGAHAAMEVDCHHVLRGGRKLEFRQVFVADAEGGRISRLRAYEPYGPGGLVGVILRLTRLGRRLHRLARPGRA